ncbi:MAG TPA: potassium channel family protein [Acidimicrobiia bacterium]
MTIESSSTIEKQSRTDRMWKYLTDQNPDPSNPRHVQAARRLDSYEARTAFAMVLLALTYLVFYSFYVLDLDLSSGERSILNTLMNVIWGIFIADLTIRTILAPRHIAYLVHHPIDVLAVAVPAFRVLRVLRVLTAGQWLISRGSRLRIGRTATAVVLAVIFLTYLSALAVVNAERGAKGATIETFGDGLWWSLVTMATVGYGDYTPVTTNGRIIAVGVMVVGISLLGLVGASVASAVVTRLSGKQQQGQDEVRSEIKQLLAEVASLRQELADAGVIKPRTPDSAPIKQNSGS